MKRKDVEKPKELIQSYLVTSARYDFSVYEKRILYRVVELIQAELKGQPIGRGITVQSTIFKDLDITMPVAKFLKEGEGDKNHHQVKKALNSLQKKTIQKEDKERWLSYAIIGDTEIKKRAETVTFRISKNLHEDLLTFAKGYSQYELSIAFSFRSQYTMRFYEMFSRCGRPSITYSIDRLREMFMLENKYRSVNMFMKYVIDPAHKELAESEAPYWFTYDKIKEGRAFKSIQFNVHYRPDFDKKLPQQTSIRWEVDKLFLELLNQSLNTDDKTWKPHKELLVKAQKKDYDEIKKILRNAQKKKNPIGYTVNAFKKLKITAQ